MVSVNKSDRVAGQKIVKQPTVYLPEGHPDIDLLDPKDVVVVRGGTKPSVKYLTVDAPPFDTAPPEVTTPPPAPGDNTGEDLDQFDLTSIEEISEPIKKYDPVTNALTYWVTLKVRNTSKNPENVKGVDARIYIPGS